MAKSRNTDGVNKSQFIRDVLTENRKATIHDINKAWNEAGNEGELNPTLYYQAKGRMGLAKGRRGRPPREAVETAAGAARVAKESAVADDGTTFLAIELELDKLIAKADGLGDSKLADSLRTARRRVAAKLI